MQKFVPRDKHGPEWHIQKRIIKLLRGREWYVKETHGSAYQSGFPDLFACHSKFGQRWIEVKNLKKYSFTAAQLECFPKFNAHGSGIWILVDATEDEYKKLMKPPNWYWYLKG